MPFAGALSRVNLISPLSVNIPGQSDAMVTDETMITSSKG